MAIVLTASRLMQAWEVKEICQIAKQQPAILQTTERHIKAYLQEKKEKAASKMLTA
jgi:hypothetical protein